MTQPGLENLVGFKAVVEAYGLILSKEGETNRLEIDPAFFKQKLGKYFEGKDKDNLIEEFKEEFFDYVDNYQCFRACLMPTTFAPSQADISLLAPKESLFKYLLGVEPIQTHTADVLLSKLTEIISQDTNYDFDTAKTIINHFRWLDQINAPSELLERLIDLLGISPLKIQHEIISALPDIFVDVDHTDLLDKLTEIAKENSELFVPVVECLGDINIPESELESLSELILNRLDSISLDSLAVAVQFLLSAVNENNIIPTIASIRTKIDLDHFRRTETSTKEDSRVVRSYESLLLDKLEKIILSSSLVRNCWLKTLEDLKKEDRLYPLDILVLIIFHNLNDTKKRVKVIFKNKILKGIFDDKYLSTTIKNYLPLIEKKTMNLLSISETLLRDSQNQPILGKTAALIYSAVFQSADIYHRQEVVGALITHIGSGNVWEIDHSLFALSTIIKTNPTDMLQFIIFVKGILDYLDRFTLKQIHSLFEIYTILALEEGVDPSEGSLKNDIHMIIRKQLTHPSTKFKNIGITATLAMIKQLSFMYTEIDTNSISSSVAGSSRGTTNHHPILEQVFSMLQLLQNTCHKSLPFLSLACNGLAELISKKELHSTIVNWIFDNFVSLFADLFITEDIHEEQDPLQLPSWPSSFKLVVWDDLNEGSVPVSIKILPTIIRHFFNNRKSYHPSFICSLFNLYQACEKFTNDSLEELDALLGCGIVMFDKELIESIDTTQATDLTNCIIMGLIIALDWYRELINAFYKDSDPSLLRKVKLRISNILEIESILDGFNVQKHHFLESGTLELTESNLSSQFNKLDLSAIRSSLRKLDPNTFQIISPEAILVHESEMDSSLGSQEMLYLLDNLKRELADPVYISGIDDNLMLTKLCKLYSCFILKSRKALVDSEELESPEATVILECLYMIIEKYPLSSETVSDETSFNKVMLLVDTFQSISDSAELTMGINCSLLLEKVLSSLAKRIPYDESSHAKIQTLIQSILSRNWDQELKKDSLVFLLKEEFNYTSNPVKILDVYLNTLMKPFVEPSDRDVYTDHPNFSPKLYNTYYSTLSKQLLELASREIIGGPEALQAILSLTKIWSEFVKIATTEQIDRLITLTTLRHGKLFVESFCKYMLPYMDAYLQNEKQTVLMIFKYVQLGTRKLQNICNIMKTSKDKALAAAVPPCRSKMEQFILLVKNIFKANHMMDAYSVGNLKHRTVTGAVISSQIDIHEIVPDQGSDDDEQIMSQVPTSLKKTRRKAPSHTNRSKAKKQRKADQPESPGPESPEPEGSPVNYYSD